MNLTWSHAVLYVRDQDKMLDFYTNVLGFEVTDSGPIAENAPEIFFLSQNPDEHHQIAMIATRADEDPPNSVNHVAFRTDAFDDANRQRTAVAAAGRRIWIAMPTVLFWPWPRPPSPRLAPCGQ